MLVEFFTDLDNEKFQRGLYLRGDDTLGKEKFSLSTLCVIILFLNSIMLFLHLEENNNEDTSIQKRRGAFIKSLWYKHGISLSLT